MKLKFVVVSVILALSVFNPVFAYDKTDERMIQTSIEKLKKDAKNNDVEGIFELMPPKFFDVMAKEANMKPRELKKRLLDFSKRVLDGLVLEDVHYDFKSAKVQKSITGREYLLINSRVKFEGAPVSRSKLLAIKDDGKWYFMRMESKTHADMIKKAYPDMKNLKIS